MAEEFTPEQLATATGTATPPVTEVRETVITPAAEVVAADYVQCDFCKCKLTTRGHVYEISDEARSFRDGNENHRKEIKKLDEEISRLNSEISQLNAKLREVANLTSQRKKFL